MRLIGVYAGVIWWDSAALPLVAAVGAFEESVAHTSGGQALPERASEALAGVHSASSPVLCGLQVGVKLVAGLVFAGVVLRQRVRR